MIARPAPGLDDDQRAEEERTCASLRERVAARALEGVGTGPSGGTPEKADPLSPLTLLADPETWYAALDSALADAGLGPGTRPSPVSPASRLVDQCRGLDR